MGKEGEGIGALSPMRWPFVINLILNGKNLEANSHPYKSRGEISSITMTTKITNPY
jgi:hypothetical protein